MLPVSLVTLVTDLPSQNNAIVLYIKTEGAEPLFVLSICNA